MPPDAPTVTLTVAPDDTAAPAVAFTRNVRAPSSSPTADTAVVVSDASTKLSEITALAS